MLVVDASVLVDALGGDAEKAIRARKALRGEELYAPGHIDIEILSAWRRHCRLGTMSPARAVEAIDNLKSLSITRVPNEPFVGRIWELRDNLTSQDAAYVALAEGLEAALVTSDKKLAGAPGSHCEIRVVR